MARPLRIEYPDAVYHVTCRGNEQQHIFRDDADRSRFLVLLNQSLAIYGVRLHSYVLMNNHFHLLVDTPHGNLSKFMRRFNVAYIGYFNRRHKRVGHLYQGRYKGILVESDVYLSVLSRYIHLNPVRVKSMEKILPREKFKSLKEYGWSSLSGYLSRRKKQDFVHYDLVLAEFGGDTDKARNEYRKALVEEMTQRIGIYNQVVGQTVLGGDEFISWVKTKFLSDERDGEAPAHRVIKGHGVKDKIVKVVLGRSNKTLEQIKSEKGTLRRVLMDLLYRHGGMTNLEVGQLFGVDYTAVSQERRRLRAFVEKDKKIAGLLRAYDFDMSRIEK